MVPLRTDQTRTGTFVTRQGIHCVYRAPNRFRRPEPFHEDVSPCHGRDTQRLAAKSQTLTSGRTAPRQLESVWMLRSSQKTQSAPAKVFIPGTSTSTPIICEAHREVRPYPHSGGIRRRLDASAVTRMGGNSTTRFIFRQETSRGSRRSRARTRRSTSRWFRSPSRR